MRIGVVADTTRLNPSTAFPTGFSGPRAASNLVRRMVCACLANGGGLNRQAVRGLVREKHERPVAMSAQVAQQPHEVR